MENQVLADNLLVQADENYKLLEYQLAIEKYEESFKLFPTLKAKFRLAGCNFKLNRLQTALKCALEAYEDRNLVNDNLLRNNMTEKILLTISKCYERLGLLDEAVKTFTIIIENCENTELLKIAEIILNNLKTALTGTAEYREFNKIMQNINFKVGSISYLISVT